MNTVVLLFSIAFSFYFLFRFIKYMGCGKCRCKERMDNKTVIITGAHDGIGYETAKNLVARGARVIIACQDPAKGTLARDKIMAETLKETVDVKYLDYASFDCVRNFANDILRTERRLDVLIHNVEVGKPDNSLTEDNLPIETQINHFGPFLLTMMLLPLLKKSRPSRIVFVSSVFHWFGRMEYDVFGRRTKHFIEQSKMYANTKLASLLFSNKLSLKLKGTGVTANSLHPGLTSTNMMKGRNFVVKFIMRMIFRNSLQGAQTIIHLSVAPKLTTVNGKYFSECKEAWQCRSAYDQQAADRLWEISETVCTSDTKQD